MKHELKISLPAYKISYAVFFVIILSLVRGVTYTFEIGIALEVPMSMLAACVCADTYTQEITSKRSEIGRLYPMKNRMYSVYKRILIQEIFLLLVAVIGYGLFFILQRPNTFYIEQYGLGSELYQFWIYFASIIITLVFWGILSNFLSCLFRSMWPGIGCCLMLWLTTCSTFGVRYLGVWNLFSYTFRDIESGDWSWICGKIACICMSVLMMAALPKVIEKRG